MKKTLLVFLIILVGLLGFISFNDNWTNLLKPDRGNEMDIPQELEDQVEEEKKTEATILAVGDVMFHMPQIRAAYSSTSKSYDFTDVFRYVKEHIESADLAIANFESVAYGNEFGVSGYPRFNSPVETISTLKETGFDILNTGNNHALDQGKQGIINTIDNIQSHGLKNIGTYKEPGENILIEEVNEIKIAFLSYCYGYNGLENLLTEEERSYMVSTIDEEKIKDDIARAKSMGSDLVSVVIHWGNEYEREPNEYQVELARKMVEWGANIILGSHPHVIQKSQIIEYEGKNNFVIYSLGNFLSNQRKSTMGNRYTEDGIMVKIQVEKDFNSGQVTIKDIEYIPTWVRKYEQNNKIKYEIIPIEDFLNNDELLMNLNSGERTRIDESYKSTMEIMSEFSIY
ncbi:MAG: CapA family protein [Tissierellia bacterium]|nr:CapA family protein [Tissierellia bacterium]